jgi:hypothetical protein
MIYIEYRFVCDRCGWVTTHNVLGAFDRPPMCLLPAGWRYEGRALVCPLCDEPD